MSARAGVRRVTAADVARSLGLSRATVGFVLNNTPGQTIPPVTRDRVLAEAERLGYRPHTAARALASGRSRIILLVLPDWPHDYSMRTHIDTAARVLDEAGYALVTTTPHPEGHAQPLWETLSPDVVLSMTPFSAEDLSRIEATGIPRIIPAAPTVAAGGEPLAHEVGPRLQVAHLVERGRRRIAFAGSPDPRLRDLVAQRQDLAAATARELTGRELAATANADELNVGELVGGWIADGVDGVVAYNDEIAALVAGTALRAGVTIPGTLAIVGHDDTPLARLYEPALTSVSIDTIGLGRYVAALALSAAEGTRTPSAPATDARIVVRASS